jgi:hypothetical protein
MQSWLQKIITRLKLLGRLHRPGDIFLFLRIFLFAAAVPALGRLSLLKLEQLLKPKHRSLSAEPAGIQKMIDYVDLVLRFGKPMIRSRCLTRGLTLYYFLRRAGLDVTLCFGLENFENRYHGHCWLVKDGVPFSEPKDPRSMYTSVHCFRS